MNIDLLVHCLSMICFSYQNLSEPEKIKVIGIICATLENLFAASEVKVRRHMFEQLKKAYEQIGNEEYKSAIDYITEKLEVE